MNEGKHKRAKKPGLLRGIGHMFRFGKHRKDGITPTETISEVGGNHLNLNQLPSGSHSTIKENGISNKLTGSISRAGPPNYQPPPPVAVGIPVTANSRSGGIQQNDVFNHRYSHYVNYEELQQQIRYDYMVFNMTK